MPGNKNAKTAKVAIITIVTLGLLTIGILSIYGYVLNWKFAFKSEDNGDNRCLAMNDSEQNFLRMCLVLQLIYLFLTFILIGSLAYMNYGDTDLLGFKLSKVTSE